MTLQKWNELEIIKNKIEPFDSKLKKTKEVSAPKFQRSILWTIQMSLSFSFFFFLKRTLARFSWPFKCLSFLYFFKKYQKKINSISKIYSSLLYYVTKLCISLNFWQLSVFFWLSLLSLSQLGQSKLWLLSTKIKLQKSNIWKCIFKWSKTDQRMVKAQLLTVCDKKSFHSFSSFFSTSSFLNLDLCSFLDMWSFVDQYTNKNVIEHMKTKFFFFIFSCPKFFLSLVTFFSFHDLVYFCLKMDIIFCVLW